MKKTTIPQLFRYKFDNFMAKGGKSMFVLLVVGFIATYILVGSFRGAIELGSAVDAERGQGFFRQIYITFLQMTDPGNMAQDIESSPWLKVPAIIAGICGIVVLSMLIGFITTALVRKMEELRKGHSKVIEEEHTLILGWDEQRVVEILRELVMANESEDNPAVVILAETPKEEMDDYLGLILPDTQNTRVITRSGSTSSLVNLEVASVDSCRSVIVLAGVSEDAPNDDKALSDAKSIKTILAVASCRNNDNELNIVAEIFDQRNYEIVQANCSHPITVTDANDILAKIIVQTSRSVGLSVAYSEILSFDGCEMYFENDDWGGITFGKLQFRFPDGVPLGIRDAQGYIFINPPVDRALKNDDDILILAEDDSTIEFRDKPVAAPADIPLKPGKIEQHIENELIIGWNRKGAIIIREYADYVLDGSRVDVIVKDPTDEVREEIQQLSDELTPLTVALIDDDPLKDETLIAAQPSSRDNIIILSGGDNETDAEKADSITILILLLLRRIFAEHPDETVHTRLITEVMDSANQSLISEAGVKDFIISNRFISMLLAQISEEADIKRVYDDLFSEDGSEIYLKPAAVYFESTPADVSFADCMGLAQKRAEVCIGIKIKAHEENAAENFGVKLIPEKNSRYSFQPDDCLIVVAEDDS
jgi:hypothetical protein